jgi:hypothetical protein
MHAMCNASLTTSAAQETALVSRSTRSAAELRCWAVKTGLIFLPAPCPSSRSHKEPAKSVCETDSFKHTVLSHKLILNYLN